MTMTMTQDILPLAAWLATAGCTHGAMKSTGVYWWAMWNLLEPVGTCWNLLEGQVKVPLVNAQQSKAVPGSKTDSKDTEWIAEMLQHGLIRPSFVPPRPQRQLRELTRYRTTLLAERACVAHRLQKVQENTNRKLSAVATTILGYPGTLCSGDAHGAPCGETDPQAVASLVRGTLRAKRAQLEAALVGQIQEQHRVVLTSQLAHSAFLEEQIAECAVTIEQFITQTTSTQLAGDTCPIPAVPAAIPARVTEGSDQVQTPFGVPTPAAPVVPPSPLSFQQAVQLLDTLPGVNQRIAQISIAEVGVEMDRFPRTAARSPSRTDVTVTRI